MLIVPDGSCGLAGIRARERHRRVRLVVVEAHDAARIAVEPKSRIESSGSSLSTPSLHSRSRRTAQGRLERLEPLLKKIEGPLEPLDGVAQLRLRPYETRLCPPEHPVHPHKLAVEVGLGDQDAQVRAQPVEPAVSRRSSP